MGSLRSLARERTLPRFEIYLERWTSGDRWCCYNLASVPDGDLAIARELMKKTKPTVSYTDLSEIPDTYDLAYYLAWFQGKWGLMGSVRDIKLHLKPWIRI